MLTRMPPPGWEGIGGAGPGARSTRFAGQQSAACTRSPRGEPGTRPGTALRLMTRPVGPRPPHRGLRGPRPGAPRRRRTDGRGRPATPGAARASGAGSRHRPPASVQHRVRRPFGLEGVDALSCPWPRRPGAGGLGHPGRPRVPQSPWGSAVGGSAIVILLVRNAHESGPWGSPAGDL